MPVRLSVNVLERRSSSSSDWMNSCLGDEYMNESKPLNIWISCWESININISLSAHVSEMHMAVFLLSGSGRCCLKNMLSLNDKNKHVNSVVREITELKCIFTFGLSAALSPSSGWYEGVVNSSEVFSQKTISTETIPAAVIGTELTLQCKVSTSC